MPTPPSARLLASINGGPPRAGGIPVGPGDAVQLLPESTAGWREQRWEIYSFPQGWSTPSGWSPAAGGAIVSTDSTPAAFALPAIGGIWGKWLLRLVVNGTIVDESTALSMPSPHGLRDLAFLEENQFSADRTWVLDQQLNLRRIDALIASMPNRIVGVFVWRNTTAGVFETFAGADFADAATAAVNVPAAAAGDTLVIDALVQATIDSAPGGALRLVVTDSISTSHALLETVVSIATPGDTRAISLPAVFVAQQTAPHVVRVQGHGTPPGANLRLEGGAILRVTVIRP